MVKTPWGLLTAVGPSTECLLREAASRFRELPPLGMHRLDQELRDVVGRRHGPAGSSVRWLFTHEVDLAWTVEREGEPFPGRPAYHARGWLGAPVSLYLHLGAGPRVARWGAVLLEREDGRVPEALARDAELYLSGHLRRGESLQARLDAALATVTWVMREEADAWGGSGEAPAGSEAAVGIHEVGHSYTVDRVGLQGIRP